MTYVSKKEKVFDLPEQDESSSISLHGGENKLKSFLSVSDRRAWTSEEFQRYQHLYGLVKDSETNITKSSGFKYIPFDVLLAILMAEKDAYIQELLERQESRSSGGKLYKSDGYEDSDDDREALIRKDAEVVALKNKIVGLGTQLEDYKETLTKAMHKLEAMDAIMSENKLLKEKIKCSEDAIRYLEGKKEELEKELEYYKAHFNASIPEDQELKHICFPSSGRGGPHLDGGDCDQAIRLSSEKDILVRQIEELQKELQKTRADAAEVEVLRNSTHLSNVNIEEIFKENKCYKAKIESMKCLELYVEELKKQAQTLTEKYKRESQKASEHLKQININNKELQILREERDRLHLRVNELTACETQYLSLKGKLQKVELIIDENEMLNKKLMQLDRLEIENEQLKLRIEQMKSTEFQALEDKKVILQLQREVAQQEEEIKRMLQHISDLSTNYPDNEICRLQIELEDKNGKLKKYEKQLDEIPVLESEIEELRHKLQKCIDEFSSDKDLLQRLQEELEACRSRCHELEEMVSQSESDPEKKDAALATTNEEDQVGVLKPAFFEKGQNTAGVPTEDSWSQSDKNHEEKSTYTIDETAITLQHLEEQNKILKNEVSNLMMKLSKIDLDELITQTNELKGVLSDKEEKIQDLGMELSATRKELETYRGLKESLEKEVELYKERVEFMTNNLSLKEDHLNAIEETVMLERKERMFATGMVRTLEEKLEEERLKRKAGETILKLQKEESNLAKQEIYNYFAEAMDHQKKMTHMSRKLNKELQTENKVLKDMKKYVEKVENRNLKCMICKLKAEVKVLKSLSKPEVQSECEALQRQVSKLLEDTDSLIEEIRELRSALDTEKSTKDFLEREVMNLQAELSACVQAGNEVFGQELAQKEALILDLQKDLAVARKELELFTKESETLREKNTRLTENVHGLELEQKDLKNQINLLQMRQEELNKIIRELEQKERENMEKVKHFEEVSALLQNPKEKASTNTELVVLRSESSKEVEEKEEIVSKVENYEEVAEDMQKFKDELTASKESIDSLQKKVEDMEEELKVKEEILKTTEEVLKSTEEILKSKEEILKSKEKALREKEDNFKALEESTRKTEEELQMAKNASMEALKELTKVNSEVRILRTRLAERENVMALEGQEGEDGNYEVDLEEKFALEEALGKMESELDDLKTKLQECKSMEEEMANLRSKKDALLQKMAGFEREIDSLKQKLSDFESLKNELNQLKSKGSSSEVSLLQDELERHKSENESFKTKNKNLKTENKNLKAENKNLKTESENIKAENDSLKEKSESLTAVNESLKTENENLKTENENLKTENENLKAENENVKAENETMKTEQKNVKEENVNLKAENENLKEEISKKEGLLEISKALPKIITEPQGQTSMEFFTPPAVLSPRSSGPLDTSEFIPVEAHKKELDELESKYKAKLLDERNNIQQESAERLKKLTEHYEKESNLRTRAFYESINTVRSSYENDIKKLVERHKLSIMRLQGLHEDEVQELNTTYETQMEAMQTQNENLVNDMRTEAAEKYKQLREQQNSDLRELSRKYEELLRECENRFQEEKRKLEESLKKGADRAKEQALKEDLSEFYQNSMAEMEEKHIQDLKKCKKSNMKKIELMKNKYEALLVEERKKYEEQLEEMLLQLQSGQRESTSTGSQKEHVTQERAPTANPNLEFNEVLHKILNEGLECLTFEELILVHSKTCFIPENSLEGDSGVGEYTPRLSRCCKHKELMAAEKEELLKRIFTLEHEMVIKQLETHEAIVNMEAAEFCRIRELKAALCTAQQKNAELKRLLSDQSKNEMGLKIDRYMSDKQASFHETNIVEKVKELEREKAEKRRLEEELQKERANTRNLAMVLETEKERHVIQRKRDADYVESIRQRLEEALNHEQKMESQLDYEVKLRTRMEAELQNLRRSLSIGSELPPTSLQIDAKAVKDIKNQDQSEVARKSRHSRSKSKSRSKSDHQQSRRI